MHELHCDMISLSPRALQLHLYELYRVAHNIRPRMPADEIGQARTLRQPIMPRHGNARGKLRSCEEIGELFEACILQGDAHEAGNGVVERDDLRGAIMTFHQKEDHRGGRIIMYGDVERALISDADLLGDVVSTRGEGEARAHDSFPSV